MFNPVSIAPTTLPKAQFRAVVLCGYGSDLYPLIEPTSGASSDEENAAKGQVKQVDGQIKALLPVAGKKMVDWVLERVEEAGVFDILVLSPASMGGAMAHHIRTRRSSTTKTELEEVPEDIARHGTVAALRWAVDKGLIKTDFILLPCDLLFSPASPAAAITLASILDRHRTDDNLMTTLYVERAAGNVVEAAKDGPAEILAIFDARSSTLLDVRELDAFDETEDIPLRTSLLSAFPSPTLSTNLVPTQLYIFSSEILPLLLDPSHDRRLRHMENLRDFSAWVSRLAWRNGGKDAVGYRSPSSLKREDGLAMGRSSMQTALGGSHSPQSLDSLPQTGANTPAANRPPLKSLTSDFINAWDKPRDLEAGKRRMAGSGGCKVLVWRVGDGWCGRGNTVAGWVEMNRAALKLLPTQATPTNTPAGVFISPDSFLHPSVYPNLGEKVGIKWCIIGKGCIVGKGSKLTNVVAMEGVVIGENCKLDNCVLSNGVQIRDRAVLKDCELGRNVIVDAESQLKNEQLVVELE